MACAERCGDEEAPPTQKAPLLPPGYVTQHGDGPAILMDQTPEIAFRALQRLPESIFTGWAEDGEREPPSGSITFADPGLTSCESGELAPDNFASKRAGYGIGEGSGRRVPTGEAEGRLTIRDSASSNVGRLLESPKREDEVQP